MSIRRGIGIYQRMIHERPYTMQAVQTVTLMSVGDAISQYIAKAKSYEDQKMNGYRTIKFGSIGLVLGPLLTKWYKTLEKVNTSPVKSAFAKKVILDQLLFAPIALACVTTLISVADGKSKQEVRSKLEKDYFQILLTNYKIWPLVQCLNFSLVPLDYRVLVTQSVAVGWNAYLSWKLNSEVT